MLLSLVSSLKLLNILKLKKTIIKLKQNEINKVHTKGFVELLSQISCNFHKFRHFSALY